MSHARKEQNGAAKEARTSSKRPPGSLPIGKADDAQEREADRAAEMVMNSPCGGQWSLSRMTGGVPLQRKCACGKSSGSEEECEECKKQKVQRKGAGPAAPSEAPPVVHEVLRSPGHPLDRNTRQFFDSRFGYDFSRVRVHTDARAAQSASAVQALAYTVGNDVVFGHGQYAPATTTGRALLAHELCHTIQTGEGTSRSAALSVSSPDHPLEVEAAHTANKLNAGGTQPGTLTSSATPRLFRQVQPPPPPVGNPGAPRRIVFLDSDVLSQIAGGNKAAAEALQAMRSGGADIRIARPTFNETQRGLPQQAAARRLIVEQLGIKIDEGGGLAGRMSTYETYGSKGVMVQTKDLPMIAAAKAAGGELWSFDGGVKASVKQLGVSLSPESSIASLTRPLDVRAGLDNVGLNEFSIATDGTVTRRPPGGGGGGGPGGGGGGPEGGGETGGGSPPPARGMALAPLAEGTSVRPASQAEIVARQRLVSQLESETAESARFAGRLRAYGAVFGGLMQVYTAITTITDAQKLQAEGTLFGDAQRNAEKLSTQSADDLNSVQAVTDGISLIGAVASVSDARARGDSEALFDLSKSLGDLGMSLTGPQDKVSDMAATLEGRVKALEVLRDFYYKLAQVPADPMAGTVPQAQAFTMYVSIEKFLGPLQTASRNYKSAADLLSFYSNYINTLAHEANKSAWALSLRRVAQALPKSTPNNPSQETRKAPPPTSQVQGPQLLPAPPPPPPSLLPGAPPPSPIRQAEDAVASAKAQTDALVTRGNALLSGSHEQPDVDAFLRDEAVWRKQVTQALDYFKAKGPDVGRAGFDEVLHSDKYGGRLDYIRKTLGGG